MIPIKPIQNTAQRFIQIFGLRSTLIIALLLGIMAISYLNTGTLNNTKDKNLITRSANQLLLTSKISQTTIALEHAIEKENWDALKPTFNALQTIHNDWVSNQEHLLADSATNQSSSAIKIKDQYDRLVYHFTQINSATNEIKLVTESIIRRAPYIDQRSHNRILISLNTIKTSEPSFLNTMGTINDLYTKQSTLHAAESVASIRRWHLLVLGSMLLLFALGLAPRLWNMQTKISSLQHNLDNALQNNIDRWHLLSTFAHQIRTPISTINNHTTSHQILPLINDILDISSISAGTLQLNPTTTNPRDLIKNIDSHFKDQATTKGLKLQTFFDDSCPTTITTDAPRLTQIIHEVVDNAIKFTDSGSIEIHTAIERIKNKDMLAIRIVDTGTGIDPKHHQSIFQPFTTPSSNTTQDHTNPALGLTLAKALAVHMGGNIKIESAPGAGSFVSIIIDPNLPTQSPTQQAA